MKYDYSIFSKAELVEFMNDNDKNYKYSTKPYYVILESKMSKLMEDIEANIATGKGLVEELNYQEYWENHNKWRRLNMEYNKLQRMLLDQLKN